MSFKTLRAIVLLMWAISGIALFTVDIIDAVNEPAETHSPSFISCPPSGCQA